MLFATQFEGNLFMVLYIWALLSLTVFHIKRTNRLVRNSLVQQYRQDAVVDLDMTISSACLFMASSKMREEMSLPRHIAESHFKSKLPDIKVKDGEVYARFQDIYVKLS